MKNVFVVVLTVFLLVSLTGCGGETPKELTNIGEYDECTLELLDATKIVTEDGIQAVRVNATYTNNGADPLYASCSFAVRGFQNDVEMNDLSDINGSEESLVREIKNGQSLSVSFVFELTDDSEVEVLIGTPTADMETVGRAVYFATEE